jgi:hypothetical protein
MSTDLNGSHPSLPIHDFFDMTAKSYDPKAGLRIGQHWYNSLARVRPDIAAKLVGTLIDPFHKDFVPTDFIQFVMDSWGD